MMNGVNNPLNIRGGYRARERLTLFLIYLVLTVTAIAVIYPIYWIILGALNPGSSLFRTSMMPTGLTFDHFRDLFVNTDYLNWYRNTLFVATMNTILSTVLIVMTAYAFSRFRFPGRRATLMSMLVLQMFPSFMGMIAIYILLLQLNLLDNLWGLVLVYAGGSIPYNAWLVKGYFDALPKSLEEAAKIDGASNAYVFFKVMLPLSVPILTFVIVTNFIGPWMDFIFARLVLRSTEKMTLAIGLYNMVSGRANTDFTRFAAGSLLVAVPIAILFLFLQRYIIEGLKAGANKG